MYTHPGKPITLRVDYQVGEINVSPTLAAYKVIDKDGTVQTSTPITVASGETYSYFTVPDTTNVLNPPQRYHQMRADVTYSALGGQFEEHIPYFVVPDLFFGYDEKTVRMLLGVKENELRDDMIDFYRSYIDLATGEMGDVFYNAIIGSDYDRANIARNLILYHTLRNLLPQLQLSILKTIQSENSVMTRFNLDFTSISKAIEDKYAYYSLLLNPVVDATVPTFLVLSSTTDPITGGTGA